MAKGPPKNAPEAVQRHINARIKVSRERGFTSTIAAIHQVGGAWGVIDWATARVEQNIGSPSELKQLHMLLRSVDMACRRQWREALEAFKEQDRIEQEQLKEQQELQLLALEVRALERRQEPDPRDVIRQRLIAAGVLCETI